MSLNNEITCLVQMLLKWRDCRDIIRSMSFKWRDCPDIIRSMSSKLVDSFLQKLVVKPDQLIKRRGKLGLIKAGVSLSGVKEWLTNKLGKDFTVSAITLSSYPVVFKNYSNTHLPEASVNCILTCL